MQDFAKTYMPNVCQSVRRNFFQKMAFSKMAQNHAHEVDIAITINLPIVLRSDLFSEYDSC